MATLIKKQPRSALRTGSSTDKTKGSNPSIVYSAMVDDAMLGCFNSVASDLVMGTGRSTFTYHGKSVTRVREIVTTWDPPKYGPTLSQEQFDVPYVLAGFFDKFISVEEGISSSKLQAKAARKFLGTVLDGHAIDPYVLNHENMAPLLNRMRYHFNCFFNVSFDPLKLYNLTGHGPNSTTDVRLSDAYLHIKNRTFAGTEAALQQLIHYIHWDKTLHAVIISDENDAVRSMVNNWDISGLENPYGNPASIVKYTVTSFVPKKFDSLRTMCPEPTAVAFFARMVASWISTRLKVYCNIDLSSQPLCHQLLARLGSKYPDLHIATVDWSEASDRIWLLLVEALMSEGHCPGWFSFMLNVCRCKDTSVSFKGTIGNDSDFESHDALIAFCEEHYDSYTISHGKYNTYSVSGIVQTTMFATMGNNITFPLQTLVFWTFLEACTDIYACETSTPREDLNFVSSFGDDGIVDARVLPTVTHFAVWLGWKLNLSKSFASGSFRESCGGDYYHGRMVRPFQPKRPDIPTDTSLRDAKLIFQAWLYMVYNNTIPIYERLNKTPIQLTKWVEKFHDVGKLGKVCLVPPEFPDGSGIRLHVKTEDILPQYTLLSQCDYADILVRFGVDPCVFSSEANPDLDDMLWPAYHNPKVRKDGLITFRAIVTRPRRLELSDLDLAHYYHYRLKASCDRDDEKPTYNPPLSFFDRDVKSMNASVLYTSNPTDDSSIASIAVKECRLYKTEQAIRFW